MGRLPGFGTLIRIYIILTGLGQLFADHHRRPTVAERLHFHAHCVMDVVIIVDDLGFFPRHRLTGEQRRSYFNPATRRWPHLAREKFTFVNLLPAARPYHEIIPARNDMWRLGETRTYLQKKKNCQNGVIQCNTNT